MSGLREQIEALPRYHLGDDETPQVIELAAVLALIFGAPPREDADLPEWDTPAVPVDPSYEHVAHRGNHVGYACGLSGPHCWACNEPWPCRAERARAAAPSDPVKP